MQGALAAILQQQRASGGGGAVGATPALGVVSAQPSYGAPPSSGVSAAASRTAISAGGPAPGMHARFGTSAVTPAPTYSGAYSGGSSAYHTRGSVDSTTIGTGGARGATSFAGTTPMSKPGVGVVAAGGGAGGGAASYDVVHLSSRNARLEEKLAKALAKNRSMAKYYDQLLSKAREQHEHDLAIASNAGRRLEEEVARLQPMQEALARERAERDRLERENERLAEAQQSDGAARREEASALSQTVTRLTEQLAQKDAELQVMRTTQTYGTSDTEMRSLLQEAKRERKDAAAREARRMREMNQQLAEIKEEAMARIAENAEAQRELQEAREHVWKADAEVDRLHAEMAEARRFEQRAKESEEEARALRSNYAQACDERDHFSRLSARAEVLEQQSAKADEERMGLQEERKGLQKALNELTDKFVLLTAEKEMLVRHSAASVHADVALADAREEITRLRRFQREDDARTSGAVSGARALAAACAEHATQHGRWEREAHGLLRATEAEFRAQRDAAVGCVAAAEADASQLAAAALEAIRAARSYVHSIKEDFAAGVRQAASLATADIVKELNGMREAVAEKDALLQRARERQAGLETDVRRARAAAQRCAAERDMAAAEVPALREHNKALMEGAGLASEALACVKRDVASLESKLAQVVEEGEGEGTSGDSALSKNHESRAEDNGQGNNYSNSSPRLSRVASSGGTMASASPARVDMSAAEALVAELAALSTIPPSRPITAEAERGSPDAEIVRRALAAARQSMGGCVGEGEGGMDGLQESANIDAGLLGYSTVRKAYLTCKLQKMGLQMYIRAMHAEAATASSGGGFAMGQAEMLRAQLANAQVERRLAAAAMEGAQGEHAVAMRMRWWLFAARLRLRASRIEASRADRQAAAIKELVASLERARTDCAASDEAAARVRDECVRLRAELGAAAQRFAADDELRRGIVRGDTVADEALREAFERAGVTDWRGKASEIAGETAVVTLLQRMAGLVKELEQGDEAVAAALVPMSGGDAGRVDRGQADALHTELSAQRDGVIGAVADAGADASAGGVAAQQLLRLKGWGVAALLQRLALERRLAELKAELAAQEAAALDAASRGREGEVRSRWEKVRMAVRLTHGTMDLKATVKRADTSPQTVELLPRKGHARSRARAQDHDDDDQYRHGPGHGSPGPLEELRSFGQSFMELHQPPSTYTPMVRGCD